AGLRLFGGPHALARMVAHQAPASPVGRGDRIVTRAPDPHVLATVVAAAFEERGISAAVASALIDNPRLLMAEGALAFLVVVDGHAVASTIAFLESPYGVLSYIGTVPAARRRGAATEVAVAAMCAAIES